MEIFLYDGAVGNFVNGGSKLNNVLWTMQIELAGSIALFIVYWIGGLSQKLKYITLFTFGFISIFLVRDAYVCFVTGALVYELQKYNYFIRLPQIIILVMFFLGVLLGFPGQGFSERVGLDALPERLQPGFGGGLIPPIAATLILISAIRLAFLAKGFSSFFPVWLGRISFGLYLVHVPILYTLVAWTYINYELPIFLLLPAYLSLTLLIAYVFTFVIDEPSLKFLKFSRKVRDCLELKWSKLPCRAP